MKGRPSHPSVSGVIPVFNGAYFDVAPFGVVDRVLVHKINRQHGFWDRPGDDLTNKRQVLCSGQRFLNRLDSRKDLTMQPRNVLDRERASYFIWVGAHVTAKESFRRLASGIRRRSEKPHSGYEDISVCSELFNGRTDIKKQGGPRPPCFCNPVS